MLARMGSLRLIVGPPNSGRTRAVLDAFRALASPDPVPVGPPTSGRAGAVLAAFRSLASQDPVLVVPTVDDVERFEGELTRSGGAVIGASVGTFDRLFGLVARAVDAPAATPLTGTQRRRIAREAVARTRLKLLAASASRPGFPAELE